MNIFTFAPFGYEGALVNVEADLRKGIPAVDIVGLSDGAVKETRERIRAAIRNSGFEFPEKRVLVSLSPADLKKEGGTMDLAVAAAIAASGEKEKFMDADVLVLGEIELSGRTRAVRAASSALHAAQKAGIRHALVPNANLSEAKSACANGMKIAGADSLAKAVRALKSGEGFKEAEPIDERSGGIAFSGSPGENGIDGTELPKKLVRAIEIVVAGKHSLLAVGKPGFGKSLAIRELVPAIAPDLTAEEAQSTLRIHSIAGLVNPKNPLPITPPFRMPHQTAMLEGMCGGGQNCRPGEVSLAHNGFLFLDEAMEFRSAALQMLRIPLESGAITLSRAGRSTVYPAKFQLLLAANPCPCGNFGSKSRLCLCSEKSIQQYWRKLGLSVADRIAVTCAIGENGETERVSVAEIRERVKSAFEIQRKRGAYNQNLSPQELLHHFKADKDAEETIASYAEEKSVSARRAASVKKVALTIANMEGRETVTREDILEAASYSKSFQAQCLEEEQEWTEKKR